MLLKVFERPSAIASIEIPDVLDEMMLPGLRC